MLYKVFPFLGIHSQQAPQKGNYEKWSQSCCVEQNKDLQRHFGDVLRRLRSQRGLSQEALAFESGLSRTFIAYLEQGQYQPTLLSLVRIARGLEMKPSEILAEFERELDL